MPWLTAGGIGASAYEIAVSAGFVGTKADWLASLHGKDGADTSSGTYLPKVSTLAVVGTGPIEAINLNYTIKTSDPNLAEVRVGAKLASYRNEWGAFRGSNPYPSYADALFRAIVNTGDFVGTSAPAFEISDRRSATQTMWGRRWNDGRLIRFGQVYSDTIVLHASDPVPTSTLPGTVIYRVPDGTVIS